MSNTIEESILFAEPASNKVAILLVDASGSVKMNYDQTVTIFYKMKSVIKGLPHEKFRIIFWNSDNERPENKFPAGVSVYPYPVDTNSIDGVFNLFANYISNKCATFTYLGVDALVNQPGWLTPDANDVYIITDGEMGYADINSWQKREMGLKLAASIRKLITSHRVNLHIYTVEAVKYNFNSESVQSFAGSDVYKVIQENQLTKSITKFVTFDLSHSESGYTHISRTNAVSGFIPYRDRLFSESKVSMFLQWIKQIVSSETNSDELLKIVQDLTPTLSALTLDKPPNVCDQIINNFCNIFRSTSLDFYLAKFILEDSIKNERAGSAQLLSTYQQQRRDFFKLANDLLSQSTSKYIGVLNYFVTFPCGNCIVTGHKSLITKSVQNYTSSAVEYQDYVLPIMPLDFEIGSDINGQCLRQWTRTVISKLYNVDALGDVIIYIVLMINMKIQLCNLPETVKLAYRHLCTVMLSKKRLNSDTTELARLVSGSFPTPNNGRVEDFYKFMTTVLEKSDFNVQVKPMTLWYAIVLAYGNAELIVSQLAHCVEDIKADYPAMAPLDLLGVFNPTPFVLIDIPPNIDYNCMISLEDCKNDGGYQFAGHTSMSNYHCQPINIISSGSFSQLFKNSETVPCPICYTDITRESFVLIGPAKTSLTILEDIPVGTPNIFGSNSYRPTFNSQKNPVKVTTTSNNIVPGPSAGEKKIWIQMVGTVGSGKTTMAKAIKRSIRELGGYCIIVGTDKYCRNGMDIGSAIAACKASLLGLADQLNPLTVAIIDTCGESKFNHKDTVFEVKLVGWKKLSIEPNCNRSNLNGYLHWSLRNVLRRTKESGCYLNPDVVSVSKCINVHLIKSKGIFGKKTRGILYGNYSSANEACEKLSEVADEYQSSLEAVEPQVERFMKRI